MSFSKEKVNNICELITIFTEVQVSDDFSQFDKVLYRKLPAL